MLFEFTPAIQAGIEAGKYIQVFSNGVPIGMVRDAATGQFVAHAVGTAAVDGNPLQALFSPVQFMLKGAGLIQTHMGFQETYRQIDSLQTGLQALQNSVGVLQATTALIGVGTVASVALGAVNLHQTLKLRKEVEEMRLEVKNGFIDLKQALKQEGLEIRQIIEQVAQDSKFEQHRLILIRAYGQFTQALYRFRSAMQLQELSRRNAEIDAVRGMLFEALADYTNPNLFSETCTAGQIRRLECAWGIEQAIAMTYQVQGEFSAVSDRLSHLKNHICENASRIIQSCESYDELDFLFPEMSRIYNHDLAIINTYQSQVDWMRSLPESELKQLASSDLNMDVIEPDYGKENKSIVTVPSEESLYKELSNKSHFDSLRDQLMFLFQPKLRGQYEDYISRQASIRGSTALGHKNLQQASDMAIANLYYYFQIRDESETKEFAIARP